MPDTRQNKAVPAQPSGSGRKGSQGSIKNAPADHSRGERKKGALEESPALPEAGQKPEKWIP